jgi:nitrogen fixation uncharacterized protein
MGDLERFRQMVLEDSDLQRRLLGEPEMEPFLALVVAAARERGFDLTRVEVQTAMDEARRSWFQRHIR